MHGQAGYVDDLFDDDGMRTSGASSADLDYANMWQKKLKTSSKAHGEKGDNSIDLCICRLFKGKTRSAPAAMAYHLSFEANFAFTRQQQKSSPSDAIDSALLA